ncbi:MAG TPA: hypothetical protein VFF53_03490 [Geobacteraceae bacterium]|nr:hypothetical protein [Aquabacterium sp.]HZV81213.1 hypothetical protein [Geobacteraceae bacterium]
MNLPMFVLGVSICLGVIGLPVTAMWCAMRGINIVRVMKIYSVAGALLLLAAVATILMEG